ncbi:hypothetical protein Trydic_g4880 [Trypoxylus dichotomus]
MAELRRREEQDGEGIVTLYNGVVLVVEFAVSYGFSEIERALSFLPPTQPEMPLNDEVCETDIILYAFFVFIKSRVKTIAILDLVEEVTTTINDEKYLMLNCCELTEAVGYTPRAVAEKVILLRNKRNNRQTTTIVFDRENKRSIPGK